MVIGNKMSQQKRLMGMPTSYTLKDSNETYERRAYELGLHKVFSRYEKFWSNFIVPLTNRPYSIQLKQGVQPELEFFAMVHYSTLYQFVLAYHQIEMLKNTAYHPEQIPIVDLSEPVFHLSSASDQAITTVLHILEVDEALKHEVDLGDWLRWVRTSMIGKKIERFKDKLTANSDLALREDFLGAREKVGAYRHRMTHGPIQMTTVEDNRLLIPIPDKIDKYWLWSEVQTAPRADLGAVFEVYRQLADRLLEETNNLWQILDPALNRISIGPRYKGFYEESCEHQSKWLIPTSPSGINNSSTVISRRYSGGSAINLNHDDQDS